MIFHESYTILFYYLRKCRKVVAIRVDCVLVLSLSLKVMKEILKCNKIQSKEHLVVCYCRPDIIKIFLLHPYKWSLPPLEIVAPENAWKSRNVLKIL